MRHQRELIRDLAMLLQSRMTGAGHLAQVVPWEHLGVCSVKGCGPSCIEARRVLALAEPFMPKQQPAPRPLKPLPHIVLKRPTRRQPPAQLPLLAGRAG